LNVPNVITVLRIALTPAFVLFFAWETAAGYAVCLGIAIAFEVTDLLDGWLARRLGQVSDLGKFLDPAADSIARFTVFLCFLSQGYASVWAVAILFWRDALVAALRIMGATHDVIISARPSGKLKAWVQGTAIIASLCFLVWPGIFGVGGENVPAVVWWLTAVAAGYTLFSLFDYLWGNRKILAAIER